MRQDVRRACVHGWFEPHKAEGRSMCSGGLDLESVDIQWCVTHEAQAVDSWCWWKLLARGGPSGAGACLFADALVVAEHKDWEW